MSAVESELDKDHTWSGKSTDLLVWRDKVNVDISLFRDEFNLFIQRKSRTDQLIQSANNAPSRSSARSSKSVESLRVKLAEQRAVRKAEELYFRKAGN